MAALRLILNLPGSPNKSRFLVDCLPLALTPTRHLLSQNLMVVKEFPS
jgi:hypothetical protein